MDFFRISNITFETESVEDEDEVLVALSEELGGFLEYVGGSEWGHVLLSPLENLAAIEEPVVRDKVCKQYSALGAVTHLLIADRPSNPSTKSAPISQASRSKNTSSLSRSDSLRQIGSPPKSRDVVFSQLLTARCHQPHRSSFASNLACWCTMKHRWSAARLLPTSPNLSKRCLPR